MEGNVAIAQSSDSASLHSYPTITLCPDREDKRENIDINNLTADFELLAPIDELVYSVEYSYQHGNRHGDNISKNIFLIHVV